MKKFHLIAWALLLAAALVLIQSLALIRGRTASAGARSNQESQASKSTTLARLGEQITLRAAGRGRPWINLGDGHDLITTYASDTGLESAMRQSHARPLSLASADFDEDGVPDLISGYGCADCATSASLLTGTNPMLRSSGTLTLHRGNVDSIYPNTTEAEQRKANGESTDAPFLSPGFVFETAVEPHFVGAGDFNADGHYDVVMAAAAAQSIHWLAGDGHGGFSVGSEIALPGRVTTMVTGEINRSDGLADLVVGITGPNGASALVFEGPEGALKAEPELIGLPAEASALAMGQLDDSYEMDLAVAAGSQLVVVHGRDRKLSLTQKAGLVSSNQGLNLRRCHLR